MRICQKCGAEFTPTRSFCGSKQKFCDKCARKHLLPTQAELAKRAGRDFVDRVQIETDTADAKNLSYGKHMARKEQGK